MDTRTDAIGDLLVAFTAETDTPEAVTLRFFDPGFGVTVPANGEPLELSLEPGQQFEVRVGTSEPRRLTVASGKGCIFDYIAPSGQLLAGLRVDGAYDPAEELQA